VNVPIVGICEVVGVVCGVTGVWLATRENVWTWPVGLLGVACLFVVFFNQRLYGSASLQLVYVVASVYGWYAWRKRGTDGTTLTVTRAPRRWLVSLLAAGLAGAIGYGFFLRTQNATLPFVDAATTSFSLVAQWLATRKWIENWFIWLVVDVVYVIMYFSQGLYLVVGLDVTFLVLAVFGLRQWNASMKRTSGAAA
jgi:nicotinamide mononucleotide transporter